VKHSILDCPGVPVDHATIKKNHHVLKDIQVPIRRRFGVVGVAPAQEEFVRRVVPLQRQGQSSEMAPLFVYWPRMSRRI
jgi:acetamidase/formamidase